MTAAVRQIRAALALLLLALAVPAGAGAQSSTAQEIRESERRLEEIREERRQLRAQMEQIRTRVYSITGELDNLARQLANSARLLAELERQVAQRQEQIDQTTRELIATQDRLAERRAVLQHRLRQIYKRGPLHAPQVLLTSRSFSELMTRYKYLFLIARHDRELVAEVERLEEQLTAREDTLRHGLARLQDAQNERAATHRSLGRLEARQQELLAAATEQQRDTERRIEQLAEDERRLSELLALLESRRREEERRAAAAAAAAGRAAAPADARLTDSDAGRLAWPVDGPLVYRFGRTTQPNGTVLRWNGVGIGGAVGAEVRAVEGGTVVMAGPFEGYGPTVVLSHGEGYYSLYLYLSDVAVEQGDEVVPGQVVGALGGEDTPEGPHIEFQIRAPGGRAVDPLRWLQNRPG